MNTTIKVGRSRDCVFEFLHFFFNVYEKACALCGGLVLSELVMVAGN